MFVVIKITVQLKIKCVVLKKTFLINQVTIYDILEDEVSFLMQV